MGGKDLKAHPAPACQGRGTFHSPGCSGFCASLGHFQKAGKTQTEVVNCTYWVLKHPQNATAAQSKSVPDFVLLRIMEVELPNI